MTVIRASEIGNYVYCRRAWWYQKQGIESAHRAELAAGIEIHRRHGRRVILAGLLRILAFLAFSIALILLVTYCTLRLV
ncbi:MAG: hypothetical protein D6770_09870 [Anaerolineae bacterium]|nr:MAG: hypothetical protein D6770_09870 [Anaerolineae bacterium]